jgi:hypothetical protein
MVTATEAELKAQIETAIARYLWRGSPIDLAIARHESAHALTAYAVAAGWHPAVSLDDAGNGVTDTRAPLPDGTLPDVLPRPERRAAIRQASRAHPAMVRAIISRQIVTILAGRVADAYGDGYHPGLGCSADDMDEAAFLADAVAGPAERDAFLAPLQVAATSIVHDGWETICALAEVIGDHRRVPGPIVSAWLDCREDARKLRDHYGAAYATPTTQGPSVVPGAVEPTDLSAGVGTRARG